MDDYTQLGRRNLTSGELIYANSMVADEIALENKEKVSKAVSESNKNRNSNSVHLDANETKTRDRSTNTREQVAKMSGVGTRRITVAEKYRPIYEKQALLNKQVAMQEARKNNDKNKSEQISVNLPKTDPINTSEKLANIAGVSEKTYRMGAKVLNSNNEDVKQRVLSGETSINAGYKELTQGKKFMNV